MKSKYFLLFILIFFLTLVKSQDNPTDELRAVWLTTVSNLDWPNYWDKGKVDKQKESFIKLIESLKEVNVNAIFFQVRTECDAFYDSSYEPWSRYLTGTQGKYPGYDPLEFATKVCHDRGLELHVWLNPYRVNASKNDSGSYYNEKHIYIKHPEWVMNYSDGKKILNPGLPEVQKYIKQIAGDIINKYDIDGIHFDDYFYSYSGTPEELDINSYITYGSEYSNIGDFRRGSINKMIAGVMDTILATKPYIRFGVSPFGIYGNDMNPPGITGLNAYHVIYCDPLAWLKEHSVDYINPQLYWTTGGFQDFEKLLPWWANWAKQYNRDVYAGHAIYRLDDNPSTSYHDFNNIIHEYKEYFNLSKNEIFRSGGWSLEEIIKQIEIVRDNRNLNANGSVYFRAKDFDRVNNLKKYIINNAYSYKALLPNQYWKNSIKPETVTNIRFETIPEKLTSRIKWDNGDSQSRYAIYDVSETDYPKPENLLNISFNNYYEPNIDSIYENLSIAIVKINRFWNRGNISESYKIPKPETPILNYPENNYSTLSRNDIFTWSTCQNAGSYEIEFSKNINFSNILEYYNIIKAELQSNILNIEGETVYYWRVRSKNISGYSPYSEIRSITTAFPRTPNFVYPTDNDKNIPLDLKFKLDISNVSDSIHLQVSRGGSKFDLTRLEIDTVFVNNNSFTPLSLLQKYTVYYARTKATNNLGNSNWSDIIKFKTLMPIPDKTDIIYPKNNSGLDENIDKITFEWNKATNANYYIFQLSNNNDFTDLIKDEKIYTGLKFNYHNPPIKTWMYARVAGKNIGGNAEWSDIIHFTLDNNVNTSDLYDDISNIFIFPNPFEDTFSINLGKEFKKVQINIYNSTGKNLLNKTVVRTHYNELLSFNIKQFICQPCFVSITTNNFTKTIKLIKNK